MPEIGFHRGQLGLALELAQQLAAHREHGRHARGCAVDASEQLLARRFGRFHQLYQVGGRARLGVATRAVENLLRIGREIVGEHGEERRAPFGAEGAVLLDERGRELDAVGFAALAHQRLAGIAQRAQRRVCAGALARLAQALKHAPLRPTSDAKGRCVSSGNVAS